MSLPVGTPSQLMRRLDGARLPRHVAIIMDGNGRWAHQRNLPRIEGHKRGKEAVRAVVESARRLGIPYLSLYAFSTENWQRPRDEVSSLMRLLRRYLVTELPRMMKNEVRLVPIGNLRRLPRGVRRALRAAVAATRGNRRLTVVLAVSYGAREEIASAVRQIARDVERGELDPGAIRASLIRRYLSTAGIPEPDLLIRTSGEMRLSNFLLWQVAYTELYLTETLWPDFREEHFLAALAEYQRRQRRFGRVPDRIEPSALSAAH